jgi:fumarate hydratase class II
MSQKATRTEQDTLGTVEVPADRLWGAQTERSLRYFSISTEVMPLDVVRALVQVKRAAALVHMELDLLDSRTGIAIVAAAEEVLAGRHDQEFPLRVWQTGSGTQTNMNVNEVLANRASELLGGERGSLRLVHPNDHVNLGQSTNDAFPSAVSLASLRAVRLGVLPEVQALRDVLAQKSREFSRVVKIGRTHLMDATPLTLGQEISGWTAQLEHAIEHLEDSLPHLAELALGGTAVGTGLNTHPEYAERVARKLAELTGEPVVSAPNKFEALAAHDSLVFAHGALKTLAVSLNKIANDVRWLASGPRAGLGELVIPENEPGSSIMPGKVNPTQCEALSMIVAQVLGNDVAINFAGASGHFELNVYRPLLGHCFLQSARLLTDGCRSFRQHLAVGIQPNYARIQHHLEQSLMLVTALSPHIGYDQAARIAKKAHAEGSTLREAALTLGLVSAEDFDRWVRPELMLGPRGGETP